MTMFEQEENASPSGQPKRPAWRRWVRRLALLMLGCLLLPYLLVPLYIHVNPPASTLMLARYITLRPVAQIWANYDDISPQLPRAVLMSEDARFCVHDGIDIDALRTVIEGFDGGKSRGASTIAMQTAKNLFLWPSQHYVRKALEIPLALWIDLVWSKRRLIEVYLNIAEWDDGIFGAEAAARHYFGRPAAALSRRQAALLAVTLPNPAARSPSRPSRRLTRMAARVEARMRAAGPWVKCLSQ